MDTSENMFLSVNYSVTYRKKYTNIKNLYYIIVFKQCLKTSLYSGVCKGCNFCVMQPPKQQAVLQ